ncbi:uncharacterized protein N7477_008291 [Penicillium maclennaniae]|uniref:uncharacterized protein n=1 Tax=Penicillium maclennaniae TaxID=1343394 RepID=UPI0025413605|nr:uncharacterized protein N7477_008291 [Penicillium maclennaniae]KAJ5665843.1 hypothetical protein N7477_008291 [Penicillium maclennaniae]
MAPLKSRQNHSLTPSTPRHPKGPSAKPVPVTTSIDPKVFGELFAGAVTIFFFAVIFWKTGKFIRSFNRHKVLREGKAAEARYARTWYGWVSLETHERNKNIFTGIFSRVREWTAWKSTRTDYRWVWWDPGQKALEERRQNRKLLAWLPECFKSYDFITADEIWNTGPPTQCHGALSDDHSQSVWPTRSMRQRRDLDDSPPSRQYFKDNEVTGKTLISQQMSKSRAKSVLSTPHELLAEHLSANAKDAKKLSRISVKVQSLPIVRPKSQALTAHRLSSIIWLDRTTYRDPSFSESSSFMTAKFTNSSHSHGMSNTSIRTIDPKPHHRHNWRRHQVWSAQMQLKAPRLVLRGLRDSSGPPGTPRTSFLASFLSEQSALSLVPERLKKCGLHLLRGSTGRFSVAFSPGNTVRKLHSTRAKLTSWGRIKYDTAPTRSRMLMNTSPTVDKRFSHPWHTLWKLKQPLHSRNALHNLWPSAEIIAQRPGYNISQPKPDLECPQPPFKELSDWEMRLIDGLDRKLVWNFNEFTPGQKPYHFACLANHWLNWETWVVIDPVSRVTQNARRQYGDPRFNVPYPDPCLDPRPKYPLAVHKRADTRRIDSWRAAINRQRRVCGLQDFVRSVELYEDSCDEPPDGKIDPACWILPKPPQGFEMSTRQKNAWYEGGAGWQEKLEDWQRVRRAIDYKKLYARAA